MTGSRIVAVTGTAPKTVTTQAELSAALAEIPVLAARDGAYSAPPGSEVARALAQRLRSDLKRVRPKS